MQTQKRPASGSASTSASGQATGSASTSASGQATGPTQGQADGNVSFWYPFKSMISLSQYVHWTLFTVIKQ